MAHENKTPSTGPPVSSTTDAGRQIRWTKRKTRNARGQARIRDEETGDFPQHPARSAEISDRRYPSDGHADVDLGNGIDMPADSRYTATSVNKVKTGQKKWAQVKMQAHGHDPNLERPYRRTREGPEKYEYTKRSMALTAPSARLSIMSLPSGGRSGWSGRVKSNHALLEKALGELLSF